MHNWGSQVRTMPKNSPRASPVVLPVPEEHARRPLFALPVTVLPLCPLGPAN